MVTVPPDAPPAVVAGASVTPGAALDAGVAADEAVLAAVVAGPADAGVLASDTFLASLPQAAAKRVSPSASAANLLRLVILTLFCLLSWVGREGCHRSSSRAFGEPLPDIHPVLSSPINTGTGTISLPPSRVAQPRSNFGQNRRVPSRWSFPQTATSETRSVVAVLHDSRELIGIEARSADERTVDVRLRHQLRDVRGLDRAAVLDS